MITLGQAEDPGSATPFDRRRNLGLHHLACGPASRQRSCSPRASPRLIASSATRGPLVQALGEEALGCARARELWELSVRLTNLSPEDSPLAR